MEEGSLFQRMKQMFQEDEDLREKPELGQEATELIRNIFRYMDKDARDIMTHRRDIVAIDGEGDIGGCAEVHAGGEPLPISHLPRGY